jgi:hypothetical protein
VYSKVFSVKKYMSTTYDLPVENISPTEHDCAKKLAFNAGLNTFILEFSGQALCSSTVHTLLVTCEVSIWDMVVFLCLVFKPCSSDFVWYVSKLST